MKPALENPTWDIRYLESPVDGIAIRYAVRPGSDRCILFLNGRSDYIEKYQDLPSDTDFPDATWIMMDHRGQGKSGGRRSHVQSYDHFSRDVAAVIETSIGNRSFAIIAHSMGGLIALHSTMKGYVAPTHLILCSPLFGILAPMPLALARLISRTFSYTPLSRLSSGAGVDRRAVFEGNILTSSRQRFDLMTRSEFKGRPPTFGWVHATFQAFTVIFDKVRLKALKIPVGIIVGDKEFVVDRMAYEGWMRSREACSGISSSYRLIVDAHHELLNEADEFRREALDFITQVLKI
jgi:lysophospholipase